MARHPSLNQLNSFCKQSAQQISLEMASTLFQIVALLSCYAASQASSFDELATAASQTAPRHTLHLHLSVDELRHVFAVERHEDVPEYDVFHVTSRRRRSLNGRHQRSVHVRAFGDEIDLDLEMNQEIDNSIRLFYADGADSDINIERVEGDTDMYVGEPYQDVSREAALLVDHADDDTLQLNGVVADLVIAPAPKHVHHHYPSSNDDDELLAGEQQELGESESHDSTARLRQRRSTPPVTRGLHVIYKRAATPQGATGSAPIEHEDDSLLIEKEPSSNGALPGAASSNRHKRSTPALYPEVLLIVDYETYMAHNFKAKAVKRYLMTFMNAVDMRYKSAKPTFLSPSRLPALSSARARKPRRIWSSTWSTVKLWTLLVRLLPSASTCSREKTSSHL